MKDSARCSTFSELEMTLKVAQTSVNPDIIVIDDSIDANSTLITNDIEGSKEATASSQNQYQYIQKMEVIENVDPFGMLNSEEKLFNFDDDENTSNFTNDKSLNELLFENQNSKNPEPVASVSEIQPNTG